MVDDLRAARLVAARDALALALMQVQHPDNPDRPLPMVRAGCAGVLADALIASGVVRDAAAVVDRDAPCSCGHGWEAPEVLVEKAAQELEPYFGGTSVTRRNAARRVLAAVWPDLPAARPVVDRGALAEAVRSVYDRHDRHAPLNHVNVVEWVEAVLAVVQDAADVRREALREAANRLRSDYAPATVALAADWLDALAREEAQR